MAVSPASRRAQQSVRCLHATLFAASSHIHSMHRLGHRGLRRRTLLRRLDSASRVYRRLLEYNNALIHDESSRRQVRLALATSIRFPAQAVEAMQSSAAADYLHKLSTATSDTLAKARTAAPGLAPTSTSAATAAKKPSFLEGLVYDLLRKSTPGKLVTEVSEIAQKHAPSAGAPAAAASRTSSTAAAAAAAAAAALPTAPTEATDGSSSGSRTIDLVDETVAAQRGDSDAAADGAANSGASNSTRLQHRRDAARRQ